MDLGNQIEYKQFGFQVEELVETDEAWIIKGWAATYTEDREKDTFHPGAFWRSVEKRHNEMLKLRGVSGVKFLFAHKQDVIIGTPLVMREDTSRGLWVEASFLKDDDFPEARRCYKLAKLKLLDKFSVGYIAIKATPLIKVKGQKRDIYEADILEFSLLSIPMNETADVEEVKCLGSEIIVDETIPEEEPEMTELEMKTLGEVVANAVKEAVREAFAEVAVKQEEVETKAEEPVVAEEVPVEVKAEAEPEVEQPVAQEVVEQIAEVEVVAAKSGAEIVEIKSMIQELLEWKHAQTAEVETKSASQTEEKGLRESLSELQAILCEGNSK